MRCEVAGRLRVLGGPSRLGGLGGRRISPGPALPACPAAAGAVGPALGARRGTRLAAPVHLLAGRVVGNAATVGLRVGALERMQLSASSTGKPTHGC